MIEKHVTLDDWSRLLLGRMPAMFMIEVLARTALIYFALLIVVKLLGKRMSGQLTNVDLAVMVVLGAIVSAPMQIAQRGLLPGAVSLLVLLCLQRAIGLATAAWPRFEQWVFGRGSTLVADGQLLLPALRRACVSHEQLHGILRAHGVRDLGEVERVYLEASGSFSVLRCSDPQPLAAIVPVTDSRPRQTASDGS